MNDCVSGSVITSAAMTTSPRAAAVPQTPMPSPAGRPSISRTKRLGSVGEAAWRSTPRDAIEQQHSAMGAGIAVLYAPAKRIQRPIERVATHDPCEHPLLVLEIGLDHVRGPWSPTRLRERALPVVSTDRRS